MIRIKVPAEYAEEITIELEPENTGLRIRVEGIATPLIHRFDVEALIRKLEEALELEIV